MGPTVEVSETLILRLEYCEKFGRVARALLDL